ncbi:ABC transporter ATP-binding protein [Pseudomonas sp. FME51]|uniref:ABC transporter ATP-binding protein n=1 Tax=Pseudomonas sp. FME51 TaxID=2742609 RepID=UPI0018675A80|nr:ABC transporter ATP-binding protein [Pseudomonas sp. FME51]
MAKFVTRLAGNQSSDALHGGLTWLYSFVRPQLPAILGLMALSLMASLLVLVQPWLTKLLIDDGLLAGQMSMLVMVVLGMMFASVFGTLLAGINRYLHTRLSGRVLFALRESIYSHLQQLSPRFFGRRRIGDLLSRLDGDIAEIQRFAIDALFSATSSLIGLAGAVVMLMLLSWKLALLVAVLVPIEILWLRWMRRRVADETRLLRERSSDMSSFLVETLPATKFIQAAGRQEHEAGRLHLLGGSYLQQLLRLQVTEFFTNAIPSTLTSLTRALAFLIGGYWVISGQWQVGSLIAFSTYLGMVVGPAQSLLGLYVAVQRMAVSLTRVTELRDEQPEVTAPEQPLPLPSAPAELVLHHIGFQYDSRQQIIIEAGDARFPVGRKIVLSGPSGSGKSTLVDLLQRFYDPDQGYISYGGMDIRQLDLAGYRQRIAVVSQDIVLFRASLADNLRYAAPETSLEQIEEVVRLAHLEELVASLPEGLATELSERGQQLSGGQRQRIAIARALLQDADVLVLDEATSAVDVQTEQAIIAEIDQLFAGRTRIVISHRPGAADDADLHYQLRAGRLTARVAEGVAD